MRKLIVHFKKQKFAARIARGFVFAICTITLVAPLGFVQAAEDQFIVRQIIGGDTTPPTVPTGLTATAISQTQIDLAWSASTDNSLIVAGYQVFRGFDFIATTTATTYSDIDLSAGTLYSYTVTAFDNSDNISLHSATATAETQPAPVVTNTVRADDGGGRAGPNLQLSYFSVSPDVNAAWVQVGTNIPAKVSLFWGKTADYELGSVASPVLLTGHVLQLSNLESNTSYYLRVELTDNLGRVIVLDGETFRTLALPDTFPPSNVSNFTATPSEYEIVLTWVNPKVDFDLVRIIRSDKFFPRDPSEGELVYEGKGERYVDSNLKTNQPYYYAAFVKDVAGNYSSGALAGARLLNPGETPSNQDLFAGIIKLPKSSIDPMLQKLSFKDINFVQDGATLNTDSNTVKIRGDRDFIMSVDYDKLPEVLKTIVVTLHDPADVTKTFSFLLRVNKDKTAYEAHVGSLGRPGKYTFDFSILDHKRQGLVAFSGSIISTVPEFAPGGQLGWFDMLTKNPLLDLGIFAALIAFIAFLFKIRRHKEILTSKVITGSLIFILCTSFALPFAIPQYANAAINKQINYQGKLTNASNIAVADGTYHMKFWLLTSPTAATTTALWAEDRSTAAGDRITVSNGLFSVMLGSSTPLTSVDFSQTLYLGVEIGGSAGSPTWDGEMSPRKKLGAVPAAIESDRVDGLSSEQFLRSDSSNSTSTASTFLTFIQSGAGKVAEFFSSTLASVLSIGQTNVGVGTTTPSAKFAVHALNGETNPNIFVVASSTAAATTTLFRIDNAGAVNAGSGSFTISSTGAITRLNGSAVNMTGGFLQMSSSGGDVWVQNNVASANSGIAIKAGVSSNDPGSAIKFEAGNAERMRILGNGRVGIGTTTPYAALSVVGETVSSYFTATTSTASIFPYASTTALTVSGTGGLQLATGLNGPLQAVSGLVSATSTMSISYGGTGLSTAPTYGQVLLGNATGGYTLTATSSLGISGGSSQWTTSASDIYYSSGNVAVGTTSSYARLSVWGAGTGTGVLANFANNASTSVMTLLDNGNVGIATTSPYSKFSVAGTGVLEQIEARNSLIPGTYTMIEPGHIVVDYPSSLAILDLNNSGIFDASGTTMNGEFGLFLEAAGATGFPERGNIHFGSTGDGSLPYQILMSLRYSGAVEINRGANIAGDLTLTGASSDIFVPQGGKIGIGTTSPYAALSVFGQTVSSYFTATSTATASTFPYASTTALTIAATNGLQLATGLNGPLQANAGTVSATSSIGVLYGGTGLTSAPSYGQVLMGNASSGYTLTATSSLGLLGSTTVSSLSSTFIPKWNGSIFQNSLLVDNGTNIGIGTSSPYAKLSVVGQILGEYFTATSTSATSTIMGTLSVGTTTPTTTAMFAVGTSTPLLSVNKNSGAVQLPQLPECASLDTGVSGSITCAPVTSYRMDQIYGRFTGEDASVFFIGDSTGSGSDSPRWAQSIIRKWDVPWVGFVAGQFESSTPDEGYQTFQQVTPIARGATFNDGSGTNDTIFKFHEKDATTGNFLSVSLTSLSNYLRGDWTRDKQIVARTIQHKPTGSWSGGNGTVDALMVGGGNASSTFPADLSVATTYGTNEFNFATPNYQPNTSITLNVYNFFTSSSAHFGAVEFYSPGKKGFSLWQAGIGSTHTYDWIHSDIDARGDYTATQIQNSFALVSRKVNTFILQLGINGSSDESGADGGVTFKRRIETIIDNWKADAEAAGGTDIKFLLINPWKTTGDDASWPELRGKILLQIAHERSYVSYIDLNKLLQEAYGDNWQRIYLSDGVHQNTAGANVIGDITWKEISKGARAQLWAATGREVLTNPGLYAGTNWSRTNDCVLSSNAATCTFSAGTASTITQTSATFATPVIPSTWYKFTYSVSGVSGNTNNLATSTFVTTAFADYSTPLDVTTAGNKTMFIKTTSAPGNFVITTTLRSGEAFTIDNFSLQQAEDSNLVVNGSITGGGLSGLKITSTGNVGVGSTTPWGKLTVQSTYGDSNPLFVVATSTSASVSVPVFMIDRLGNVGIGTTSPYAKLSVVGEAVATNFTATSTTATSSFAGSVGIGTTTPFGKFSIHALTSDVLNVPIFNVASSTGSATSTLFTIDRAGNVGVGTSSPYAKLSVSGQVVGQYFTATSTSVASTFPYASTTALTVSGNAYHPNSSIWNSSGMIGLGTTTPNADDFIAIRAPSIVSQVGKAFISMTGPNSVVDTKFGIEYIDYPVQSGANVADEYFNVFKRTGKTNSNINLSGTEFKFVNEFPYYNPGISATTTELYYELNNTRTGLSAVRPWGMEVILDTGKALTSYTNTQSFTIATTTNRNSTVFRVDGNPGTVYIEGGLNVGAAGVGTNNVTSGIILANKTPTVTLNNLYADTSANLTWSQGTSWQGASLFNTGNSGLTLAMSVKRTAQFDSGVSSQSAITAFGRSGQTVDILNIKNVSGGTNVFNVGFAPDYKVGIGTTTPWAKFSINASSTVPYFAVGSTTATHFVIDTSGNTGIGSSTPWRKLSVNGTVAFNGLTSSVTGNAVCIATTKDITDAGAASCVPSSIRFKENVETLNPGFAIDELNQLRVVSFDYKDGYYSPEDRKESYGMIAEEVEEIDPNLVDYGYDGQPMTLKFEKILGLTVQAVQELSQRNLTAITAGLSMDFVLQGLRDLGVEISNGFAHITKAMVDSLTVGSREKPTGITLFDEVTGEPYCIKIVSGKMKSVEGECKDVSGEEDDNGDNGGTVTPPITQVEEETVVPIGEVVEGGGNVTITPEGDNAGGDTPTPSPDDGGEAPATDGGSTGGDTGGGSDAGGDTSGTPTP